MGSHRRPQTQNRKSRTANRWEHEQAREGQRPELGGTVPVQPGSVRVLWSAVNYGLSKLPARAPFQDGPHIRSTTGSGALDGVSLPRKAGKNSAADLCADDPPSHLLR